MCPHGSAVRISFKDLERVTSRSAERMKVRARSCGRSSRATSCSRWRSSRHGGARAVAGRLVAWPWSPKRGLGLALRHPGRARSSSSRCCTPARRPSARPARDRQGAGSRPTSISGVLAFVAVLIHAGFQLPARRRWAGGCFVLSLLDDRHRARSACSCRSGSRPRWPRACAWRRSTSASPSWSTQLRDEADKLVQGTSDVLERFYRSEVRAPLSRGAARRGPTSSTCAAAASARSSRSAASAQFVDAGEKAEGRRTS